jgi:hypothetical protein
MNQNEEVDRVLRAFRRAFTNSGHFVVSKTPPTFWPFLPEQIQPLYSAELASRVFEDLKELRKMGWDNKRIAGLFGGSGWSQFIRLIFVGLQGSKFIFRGKPEKRVEFLNEAIDVFKALKSEDPYSEENRTFVFTKEEVEKHAKELPWDTAITDEEKNLLKRLEALAYAFSECLYFCYGLENVHGPYDVSKYFPGGKTILVVRGFYRLKPTEIWPELMEFPFSEIEIYAVYRDAEVRFDIINFDYEKDIHKKLVAFCIVARDGKKETILKTEEDYEKLINAYEKWIFEVGKRVDGMSIIDKAKHWAKTNFYIEKPLRDAIGKDWKPPKEVYERIEKEGLWKMPPVFESQEQADMVFRMLFDPRVEMRF